MKTGLLHMGTGVVEKGRLKASSRTVEDMT
jgi:hypothetical protein